MTVSYKGVEYKVGYNRDAAAAAENAGLNVNEIETKPNVMVTILVYHAFAAHNRGISRRLVDEIFQSIGNKGDFVSALVEQYAETVNSLLDNSGEGNANWTMD